MCRQCRQLEKKIALYRHRGDGASGDQELDLLILEIFQAASLVLETASNKGNIQSDLDQAIGNLTKMYELDAPECLIRKAHSVHGKRLRDFRASLRDSRGTGAVDPRRRRKQFIVVRGDKP